LAAKYCYEGDYENAKKYANKSLDAGWKPSCVVLGVCYHQRNFN
jgi:hypothetical protein